MSLTDKLEVWGFENDIMIYRDFSLGQILRLKPRDVSTSTDDEINSIHHVTCDFLNGLPEGTSLQFVQGIDETASSLFEKHRDLAVETAKPIVGKVLAERTGRLEALNVSGESPAQNLYLVIRAPFRKKPPAQKSRFAFWNRPKAEQQFSEETLAQELRSFAQIVADVQDGLRTIGVNSKALDESETFGLLFDQWNPDHAIGPDSFNSENFRDDLILSDLVMSLRGFSIGTVHHRVISLKIMPDQTFASMSEKLRELPFGSRLYLSVEVLNQDRETTSLKTQRRIAYAMYSGKRGVSDLKSEAKLKDIESLLSGRIAGTEQIFSVALNVVLRNENESALGEQVGQVLQTVRSLSGAEGMVETLAAGSMFLEFSLPNARARERSRRMNTSVLADFLPIFGDWSGHEEPRVLLRNRQGAVIEFDPFSPTHANFNQVMSGGSGSGKSFLTNVLLLQLLKEDPKVFILDVGGSYQKLTRALGGQYVSLGTDSAISLNPFDLTDHGPDAVDQKIKFMTSLVELMTKEDESKSIGKLERSEIERLIKDILREEPESRLSSLRDRMLQSSEVEISRMGKIRGPWCGDSPYWKFVDEKTNLALHSRVVCFDLKGLEAKPDLQAVCLFLITDLIWREVQKDRTTAKFVVFDESWSLLNSDAGARFIGEVFRTFRKYRASAIAISQSMDDFSKSKVASAILPNSSIKWVLKQTGASIESLKETLLLNSREMKLVESVSSKKGHFSEAFLVSGDERQVVVVESTPLEYWLSTTDSQDLKKLEEIRQSSPDLTDSEQLDLAAARFPRGSQPV